MFYNGLEMLSELKKMSKEQGLIQSDPATSPHHQIGKYISKQRTLFIRYNGRIAIGNLSVVHLIDCNVCHVTSSFR